MTPIPIKSYMLIILFYPFWVTGQNYTSYFTGNPKDTLTHPSGGICMMGGATEDDNAMRWFLQSADGGDVLILRTSGSDGYNSYMFSLGVSINSVETIVCHNLSASNEPYVLEKIRQAEAIWFAGGDQWTYVRYWRNTPVDSLINIGLRQRHIVIGGTSAGMAILGKYYFTAQSGTVTSAVALANPYHSKVKVDSARFLMIDHMNEVITDTHFDNPDRKGRLVAFIARIYEDYGVFGKGIACDEYTAVCVDRNGIAKVYGGYPSYDDNAYFVQSNCELAVRIPENCTSGNPLTWDLGGEALKVYRIKGTSGGTNTFDLNDWKKGAGGTWLNWSASNGTLAETPGTALKCSSNTVPEWLPGKDILLYPNPTTGKVILYADKRNLFSCKILVINSLGLVMPTETRFLSVHSTEFDLSCFSSGVYFFQITDPCKGNSYKTLIKTDH